MTHFPVLRPLIGIASATLGLLLAWGTDLPKGFGAHPWWSTDVIWIGGVAGVLAGLAIHRTPRTGVTAFLLISVLGFLTARWGGQAFAASFAEDQFAGTAWYWGWIATFVGLSAALTVVPAIARPTLPSGG